MKEENQINNNDEFVKGAIRRKVHGFTSAMKY
jgi:hypothetical protein